MYNHFIRVHDYPTHNTYINIMKMVIGLYNRGILSYPNKKLIYTEFIYIANEETDGLTTFHHYNNNIKNSSGYASLEGSTDIVMKLRKLFNLNLYSDIDNEYMVNKDAKNCEELLVYDINRDMYKEFSHALSNSNDEPLDYNCKRVKFEKAIAAKDLNIK